MAGKTLVSYHSNTTTPGQRFDGDLNTRRIHCRPMNSPVWYQARVKRNGTWFPAKSMEKVDKNGRLKMDIRIGAVNVRAYTKPEDIEAMNGDWICYKCGRINGKDYSNCNGCGGGRA